MDNSQSGFYLGIKFLGSEKSYNFSCPDENFALGDLVIVMTSSGVEAGTVTTAPIPLSKYSSSLELKPILRKADERDVRDYKRNLEDAKKALQITRKEIENLKLPMDLIDAYYTIDGSRITISYTSPEKRVDFRELLKVLAPQIGCRIELRQIASRDKAKMIGGIGICGLPLCCSTFLTQFEGISIQRAKNQMLTLNIPKLSGPCGKLICCLTYEDEAYTEAKKEFPSFGTVVKMDEGPYSVDAINILSRTVRIVNATRSDYKTFSLEDFRALQNGTYQRKVEITKLEETPLPSFGIELPREKKQDNHGKNQEKNQKFDNRNPNRQDSRQDRNNKQQNNKPQNQQNNRQQNQQRPQGNNSPNNRGKDNNRDNQNKNRLNNQNRNASARHENAQQPRRENQQQQNRPQGNAQKPNPNNNPQRQGQPQNNNGQDNPHRHNRHRHYRGGASKNEGGES